MIPPWFAALLLACAASSASAQLGELWLHAYALPATLLQAYAAPALVMGTRVSH